LGRPPSQQLGGPTVDGQLGLQLRDAPARGDQFGVLSGGDAVVIGVLRA
jgi:hypothetical protein